MSRMSDSRISLRARLTLVASGALAVTVALAAVLLVATVRHSVLRNLDGSARQQAKDVAALAVSGRLPDPIPVGAGTAGVQIVDSQGRVLAVSAGADRLTSLLEAADLRSVRAGRVRVIDGARLGTPDALRVVGYPIPAGAGRPAGQTVLVAVSEAEATGSLRALILALAVVGPVLLGAFALVCWLLIGRALQPVSRLRSGAEEIAAAGSADGRRLPVPRADDEVHRLALTLNGMLDRLEDSSTAQRAFVADAAHELRSPLTAIRTQLEVARRHPGSAPWEETADGVLADTDRLARLVDDLLLLARSSEPAAAVRSAEDVDLAEVVRQVAARPWPRPVTLVAAADGSDPPGPVAWLRADPDGVTRIVTNLIDNASRYAASGVEVRVRTAAGGQVELTVDDDGPGVPPEDRERVFERFARLDPARARGPAHEAGSGLGLAIVRSLVLAGGGRVEIVEPPSGHGTRVRVTWLTAGRGAEHSGPARR